MPLTSAVADDVGDHLIGKTDIGALETAYLGLSLTDPGLSGSIAGELTGTGYARIELTSKMSAFSAGLASNTAEINYGTPGSDWGTPAYVFVINSASGAGTVKYTEQIPSPRFVSSGGRPVKFAIGELTIRHR